MGNNNCPFCGAGQTIQCDGKTPSIFFACGTWPVGNTYQRSDSCKDRQITTIQNQLSECQRQNHELRGELEESNGLLLWTKGIIDKSRFFLRWAVGIDIHGSKITQKRLFLLYEKVCKYLSKPNLVDKVTKEG